MSNTTRASAPGPLEGARASRLVRGAPVMASRSIGNMLRVDAPHASRHVLRGPLAWTDYVHVPFANLPPVVSFPPVVVASPLGSSPAADGSAIDVPMSRRASRPEVTAAEARHVSRRVNPQPVLPMPVRERDVRTGLRRQRFYPEQWRRLQQPVIERLVKAHGQSLQWIGWERSLPKLYLPANHLTRVLLDLLQVMLRNLQPDDTNDQSMCLRVGWQIGVTQSLVLVLEHPQLRLPTALMQYLSAPLAQPGRAAQTPPDADELVRVRSMLKAVGGSITASRCKGGGTQFRLSIPADDRTTLVRAWLEHAAHDAILSEKCGSLASESERASTIYQSHVSLFVVGRQQAETASALNRADARLQSLSGSGDFVYRAARGRWLWMTMHGELPALESQDGWQSQIVSRWSYFVQAALLTEQQTAAFHGLARAIVAKMDLVLGRRLPPLDVLTARPPRSRHLRVDPAAASMLAGPSLRPAHVSQGVAASPSDRRRRWRYPI